METGKIQRLTDRGFGFIEAESDSYDDDLFFHANELEGVEFDDLSEGETVSFEVTETPKGMNAVNVSRADDAGADADEDEEAVV
jgi:CspA family cold shock protein